MLKQVRPPSEPPYYVCTKCNWAWQSLQEANRHACNGNPPAEPAFCSISKSVWVKPKPQKQTCDKLAVCQSKMSPSCPVGVCRLAFLAGVVG
jgi:hypothetical protein